MGDVYRCRHIHLDRPQAIKVMHDHLVADPGFQDRFRREANTIASLDHPNMVKLFDFGEQDGRYYITMELLEEGSLRALMDRRVREYQQWPTTFGVALIRQAAEVLAFAHERGMVHRDLKPDNMLVQRQRDQAGRSTYQIKISDFGLVQIADGSGLTAMGGSVGTPAYMSPEQCQGEVLDGRSDIYSLGVVFYELMTGYLPFNINSPSDAIQKHAFTAVPLPRSVKPDLPESVEAVILRCLAKKPQDRYANAAELAQALRDLARVLAPAPVAAPPTPPPEPNARHIQVLDPNGRVIQAVDLADVELMVGRAPDNDIILNDPQISRKHVRIEWNGRQLRVVDLGSKSGTRLDNRPIPADEPQIWSIQQALQIGSYTLRLALGTSGVVQVTLSTEHQRLLLQPGQAIQVPVTVRNRGNDPETFMVMVDEWPAAWIAVPVQPVLVQPQAAASTAMTLLVPPGTLNESATFSVKVCVIGQNRPDRSDVTAATWRVEVPLRPRVQLQVSPERIQAREQGRYTLKLRNPSRQPIEVLLNAQDERQQMMFGFTQNHLTIAPEQETEIALTVRINAGGRLLGGAVNHPFRISAAVVGGETETINAVFVQTALLSL
jgi:serine/threonine protein kinase